MNRESPAADCVTAGIAKTAITADEQTLRTDLMKSAPRKM